MVLRLSRKYHGCLSQRKAHLSKRSLKENQRFINARFRKSQPRLYHQHWTKGQKNSQGFIRGKYLIQYLGRKN